MERSTKLEVRKSPAGVCWWVVFAGAQQPLATRDTKYEAEQLLIELSRILRLAGG